MNYYNNRKIEELKKEVVIKHIRINEVTYDVKVISLEEGQSYDFVTFMSVEEYLNIIKTPGFNRKDFEDELHKQGIKISVTYPPYDAKRKSDIRKMSIEELVNATNKMCAQQSGIIYMYAYGYGFDRSFLTDLMEYYGCTVDESLTTNQHHPVYKVPEKIINEPMGVASNYSNEIAGKPAGVKIVEIEEKNVGTKHKTSFYLNEEEDKMFQDIVGCYSQYEQGKIIKVLLAEKLKELSSYDEIRVKHPDRVGRILQKRTSIAEIDVDHIDCVDDEKKEEKMIDNDDDYIFIFEN